MKRFRPRPVPTIVALIAFVILASLGTWQVQRLSWKSDLLETMAERTAAAAVPLAGLPVDDPAAVAWRRVHVAGRFVSPAGPAQLYGVEQRNGALGGRLLGVFETEGGSALLVDRGFAPEAGPAPALPEGQVELDAVLRDRSADDSSLFLPDNDPKAGRWFWLDLAALGEQFGYRLEPVALQLLPGSPGATPQAAAPMINLPNNHLGYAITWYGLALALLVIYVVFSSERTDRTS